MAKHVLTDAYVTINGTDLSNRVSSVTITTTRSEVDVTSMGDAFMSYVGGIPDATIEVAYFQDFAAGSVDAVHWPLVTTSKDAPFYVFARDSKTAAGSSTNPGYLMSALILGDYQPIAGDVGSALTTTVTYRNASATGITKMTT